MLFWHVDTIATSQHDLLNAHCARYTKVLCWTIGVEFEEMKRKYVDLKDCSMFGVTGTGKC
jgi:predicted PolB exonuclease-like 3'-5' exonuclease